MSGLLALLDDVAALAKVAAASVDDVVAQAAKAGTKAAGVLIDDAAVTPKYVTGFDAKRELPIIWRITRGSLINKLVFLLPAALLLSSFAPWLITPLLMLGGCYLCFEGAEKVFHLLFPHADPKVEADLTPRDPAHLEEERVRGAIKTDFILSAEIMTISLAAIPESGIWMEAATLAVVAVGITVLVYGSVALIVKADDIGLAMAARGRLGLTRAVGRGLVAYMPSFLKLLSTVGTLAMLWVGGSILIHGLKDLGWSVIYDWIHDLAVAAAAAVGEGLAGFTDWSVTAGLDGVFGLAVGLLLIPVVTRVIGPVVASVSGKQVKPH
jgi:predicted DNA repair protein MutK